MKLIGVGFLLSAVLLFGQEDRPIRYFPTTSMPQIGGTCSAITPFVWDWQLGALLNCIAPTKTANAGTWHVFGEGNSAPGGLSGTVQFNNAGLFGGIPGSSAEPTAPTFAGLSDIFNQFRVAVNNYPYTSQFGDNTVGLVEAVVGATDIPVSANFNNHSTGTAGYARTASSSNGAVGLFGGGMSTGVAGSAWGLNTVTSNCPTLNHCTNGVPSILWGYEADFNNGTPPASVIRGVHVLGGSTAAAGNFSDGFSTGVLGINQNPKIRWTRAFHSTDGSVSTAALDVGMSTIADYSVVSCSNTSPMVLTMADAVDGSLTHDMSNGQTVIISGVTGNTNCNGTFTVTVTSPTQISIGGTGHGAYAGGGVIRVASIGSQAIILNSHNAAGVLGQSKIQNDAGSNLVISPPTGAILALLDDSLTARVAVQPTTLFPAGMVTIGSPLQWAGGAEPTCAANTRGSVQYVAGGVLAADTFRVCLKNASDVYAWVVLATPAP